MRRKIIFLSVLALVLLFCGSVIAQDMSFLTSTGVGVRSTDKSITIAQGVRTVMQITPKIFTIAAVQGDIEPSDEVKDYGIGAEIGFIASDRVTVHVSGVYQKTDIDADSLKDSDLDAGVFQLGAKWWFTSLEKDENELIGLGLTLAYNERTQDLGVFGSLEFWFGRRPSNPNTTSGN